MQEETKITVSGGELEEVAVDEMARRTEKGISSAKQMARTELNYYCELLCALKEVNSSLKELTDVFILSNADKLRTAFARAEEETKS